MILPKYIQKAETEFIICKRCETELRLKHCTLEDILRIHSWVEFHDQAAPYLLCKQCANYRKLKRLLYTFTKLFNTLSSSHSYKKKTKEHYEPTCYHCLLLKRAQVVLQDFTEHMAHSSFGYITSLNEDSTFEDGYAFKFDRDLPQRPPKALLNKTQHLPDLVTNTTPEDLIANNSLMFVTDEVNNILESPAPNNLSGDIDKENIDDSNNLHIDNQPVLNSSVTQTQASSDPFVSKIMFLLFIPIFLVILLGLIIDPPFLKH